MRNVSQKGFAMSPKDYVDLLGVVKKLWIWFSTRKFKQVFGRDTGEKYHVIYNIKYVPNDKKIVFEKVEPKVPRNNYCGTQNLTTVNSCATTRAIGHLVYSFGEKVNKPPIISSDVDTDDKMALSFISIGGLTNLKTCDVLQDKSNHFLDFHHIRDKKGTKHFIVHRHSRLPIIEFSSCVAYGFIIKIIPEGHPDRTWICCAGFEEWGTSGAAWFLARRWKDICKWAKGKPFAIITKTDYESDESTDFVHKFLTSEEVEDVIRKMTPTVTETTIKTETKQSTSTAAPSASS